MSALITLRACENLGFTLSVTDRPFLDSIQTSPGRPPHELEVEIRRNREGLVALIEEGVAKPCEHRERESRL